MVNFPKNSNQKLFRDRIAKLDLGSKRIVILSVFADSFLSEKLLESNKGVLVCGVCFVDSVSCLFRAIISNNIDRPNLDIGEECLRILKKKYGSVDKLRTLFELSEMFHGNGVSSERGLVNGNGV
jgi:hypothetical protein